MKRNYKTRNDLRVSKIVEILQRIAAALFLIWFVVFTVVFIYGAVTQSVELVATVALSLFIILIPCAVGGILYVVYVLFKEAIDFIIHGNKQ
jgi:TRAP-type C4-dicarboxylate transport system permease small subunit